MNMVGMTGRRKNSSLFEDELGLFEKRRSLNIFFVKREGTGGEEEGSVSCVLGGVLTPLHILSFHSHNHLEVGSPIHLTYGISLVNKLDQRDEDLFDYKDQTLSTTCCSF